MVLCEHGGRSLACGNQLRVLGVRIGTRRWIGKLLLMPQRWQWWPVFVDRMKEEEGETRRGGLDGRFVGPEDRPPVVLWSCR